MGFAAHRALRAARGVRLHDGTVVADVVGCLHHEQCVPAAAAGVGKHPPGVPESIANLVGQAGAIVFCHGITVFHESMPTPSSTAQLSASRMLTWGSCGSLGGSLPVTRFQPSVMSLRVP